MNMKKIEALKEWLIDNGDYNADEIKDADIKQTSWDKNTFEIYNREYMVLTDEEADKRVKEDIKESVWAFNADFIIRHSRALDYDDGSRQIIKAIQEQCENGNKAMLKLIDDFDDFVEDAIESDGRGHFLNTYDGVEHEFQMSNWEWYYIYRMN